MPLTAENVANWGGLVDNENQPFKIEFYAGLMYDFNIIV